MSAGLLIARTRMILWMALFIGATFTTLELVGAASLADPFWVKCVGASITAAALVILRQSWVQRHALAVSLVVVGSGYLMTAISGIVSPSREYETTAVLFVGAALTTATLLPWGMWAQIGTTLFGMALLCVAVLWADGNLNVMTSDPGAAVAIALGLSMLTAYEVQRYRAVSIRELAARRQAEREIRALNAALEERVAARTAELQAANAQLQALSARIESVREDERIHIAREIHDELGQMLTALKIDLDLLPRHIAEAGAGRTDKVAERLAAMGEMAATMMDSVRRISAELRPSILDDLGLVSAVEWLGREFERRCGVPCTFAGTALRGDLDPACATAVFRIVQEALSNVARHAHATRVAIMLESNEHDLAVEVVDDGRGITEADLRDPRSLGLLGMRERARLVGGEVDAGAGPTGGTSVRVRLPLMSQNPLSYQLSR